jgi:sialic acid synthase SpsE
MKKKKCFIIAEAGTSHGGDLKKGKELISAAVESGADCIKFQLVYADEIIHPKTGTVPLPGGDVPLYETFRKLEQPPEFYASLRETAGNAGIGFLCTPFGIQSARILRELGVEMLKIASPELNYVSLLEEIAGYGMPIILSTGVSTLADIDEALRLLRPDGNPGPDITLLHCITAYPAPEEEYNLRCIPNLAALFGVSAGVSDHSLDPVLVPALSAALGAAIIEKHLCLGRDGGGLDDPIALEPEAFETMAREVRRIEELQGKDCGGAVDELRRVYGPDRVDAVLGDGVKRLSPSEAANYGRSNRSVHALKDLPAGTVLAGEHIAVLRTEKVLRPGLHPRYYSTILGKRLTGTVEAGQGITWDDLLS